MTGSQAARSIGWGVDMALGPARVLQVNVSPGGVPKLPVLGPVRVTRLGLDGDAHREETVHGGPHRAVALFAIEAIRRVAAEGHPIAPGTAGENLTTEGIELARLPVGTRLAIGDELVLELSAPDNPCRTIRGSFSDGRFARISILTHPTDSRMYARVLREGIVQPGDRIIVLPPAPDSRATELALLARVDAARRASSVAIWQAAAAAGLDVRVVDDGEIALVASPALPGPWLNRTAGLVLLPNLVERALDHFRAAGTTGWLDLDPADPATPAGEPDEWMTVHAGEPGRVGGEPASAGAEAASAGGEPGRVWAGGEPSRGAAASSVAGLVVRQIEPAEAETWARTLTADDVVGPGEARAWVALVPHLARTPHHSLWLAELDGVPVATGSLHVRRGVGWLRAANVTQAARGRGIHRALIAARARAAAEAGCELVAAEASPGSVSERNLRSIGLAPITRYGLYRTEPGAG